MATGVCDVRKSSNHTAGDSHSVACGQSFRLEVLYTKVQMTSEQSRQLKVGARVYFGGDQADRGTVTANQARYVTIKWDDGHESFTGHNEMQRVEIAQGRKLKS